MPVNRADMAWNHSSECVTTEAVIEIVVFIA
jgi:hypothetical protein